MVDRKTKEMLTFLDGYYANLNTRLDTLRDNLKAGNDRLVRFLKDDDPIQFVVRGLSMCEEKMKEIIETFDLKVLVDRNNVRGYLNALLAAGLLEKSEVPPYTKLNGLRNKFAHNPDLQVTPQIARDLWNTLNLEQRKHMKRNLDVDSSSIKHNPSHVIRAVILRLYMHLESIRAKEDLKAKLKEITNKDV